MAEVYEPPPFSRNEDEVLLRDFQKPLDLNTEKTKIKENAVACRHAFSPWGAFGCPGADPNCFGISGEGTKFDWCKLYQGYRKYGGKIGYFRHEIGVLKDNGQDTSRMEKILNDMIADLKKKNLSEANKKLKNLYESVNYGKEMLEKTALAP